MCFSLQETRNMKSASPPYYYNTSILLPNNLHNSPTLLTRRGTTRSWPLKLLTKADRQSVESKCDCLSVHSLSDISRLDYTGDVVKVFLKNDKLVTVHKTILCKSSAYFRSRCSDGAWKANLGNIGIPMWESDFLTYLHWLYTGTLDIAEEVWPAVNASDTSSHSKPTSGRLFDCYRFGDFVEDTRFCNVVTDRLREFCKAVKSTSNEKRSPTPKTAAEFRADSGMMRLMLDLVASSGE